MSVCLVGRVLQYRFLDRSVLKWKGFVIELIN